MIAVGGAGIGLAWKTEILDKILPPNIKEFLGKEITPTDGEPTNGEEPNGNRTEPTPEDPTKDWNTYTDTSYGFSVKYPLTWVEKNIATGDIIATPGGQILRGVSFENSEASAGVSAIFERTEESDSIEYVKSVAAIDLDPNAYPVSIERQIAVGDLQGVMASHIIPGMDYAYRAYYAAVIKGGIAYSLQVRIAVEDDGYTPRDEGSRVSLSTLNAMVGSLEIID